MMRVILLLAALTVTAPALAQTDAPDTEGGRYFLRQVEDGFLRIDRQSGDTSICRSDDRGWTCRAVPDDREALEAEIARLGEENADLARRVDELQQQLADRDGAGSQDESLAEPPSEEESALDLPSEKELDQIMDTFESMMRRFLGMVRSLKDDMERDPI